MGVACPDSDRLPLGAHGEPLISAASPSALSLLAQPKAASG
jgi:hypothetical protein